MIKRSSKIVPRPVQIRVTLILLAVAALFVLPWALSLSPQLILAFEVPLLAVGLYELWCFWPKAQWGIPRRSKGQLRSPRAQSFHLSFDDGPSPGLTDRVLDVLRQNKIQASFFVLLHKARKSPEIIRRAVLEGHEIGLHGEDHRFPFFRSADELTESLTRARDELEKIAGREVRLYRPSHGWKNLALVRAVGRVGLQFCFWDYGVWDTDAPPPGRLEARLGIASAPSGRVAKSVILLHDGLGDETGEVPHQAALLTALSGWLGGTRVQ